LPEKNDNEARIGVFICHCGSNIAGYLTMEELSDYAETLPNVTYVQRNLYTCSESGINEIKKAIQIRKPQPGGGGLLFAPHP
jgi:heterodisulfide reductase subunit A